jgi:hypothetical protein
MQLTRPQLPGPGGMCTAAWILRRYRIPSQNAGRLAYGQGPPQ